MVIFFYIHKVCQFLTDCLIQFLWILFEEVVVTFSQIRKSYLFAINAETASNVSKESKLGIPTTECSNPLYLQEQLKLNNMLDKRSAILLYKFISIELK